MKSSIAVTRSESSPGSSDRRVRTDGTAARGLREVLVQYRETHRPLGAPDSGFGGVERRQTGDRVVHPRRDLPLDLHGGLFPRRRGAGDPQGHLLDLPPSVGTIESQVTEPLFPRNTVQ